MKSVKKIVGILFVVCLVLSAFSVASFAESFVIDNSLGDQCYKVNFVSSIDEKKGTVYIEDSIIEIYKVPDNATASSKYIDKDYYYGQATTDEKGEATVSVAPGTYLVRENNFKHDGKTYSSELLTVTITEESNYFTLYFKHSLVSTDSGDVSTNPITGDNAWPIYVCIGALLVSVPVVILLIKKDSEENGKAKEAKEK